MPERVSQNNQEKPSLDSDSSPSNDQSKGYSASADRNEVSAGTSESFLATQQAQLSRWGLWLRNFWPSPAKVDAKELLRMALGVFAGLVVTGLLSQQWAPDGDSPWLVSSLGASAVLVFGMPSSPLAQPWPVLGGTVVSALAGAFSQWLLKDPIWATAIAVGLSVLLMVPLRCMHPPGAGFAAYVVLEHVNGVALVAFPIFFNVLILVLSAVIFNALTGRRYPHPQHSFNARTTLSAQFSSADLDVALSRYNQVLDISRADLEGLLHEVGRAAFHRTLGNFRCKDLMSKPAYAVEAGVLLSEAWELMLQEQVKALPVVDRSRKVVGLISTSDYLKSNHFTQETFAEKLRHMVPWGEKRSRPQKVVDIMSVDVTCGHPLTLVLDLLPLFAEKGLRHIPIVDDQNVLLGVVTLTDLLKVLSQSLLGNNHKIIDDNSL